jgi:hypothetical protein
MNKKNQVRSIVIWQAVIMAVFLLMTTTNEVLDLPHALLGDQATTWGQRSGEITIEVIIFFLVISLELLLFKRLFNRIRILEGFLPICANCKKIRTETHWEEIEAYISRNTPVAFSHSICPECQKKLYPELFPFKD